MITVALIDDHLIVRSGFAQLLGLEPDLQVVAEFGSGREALAGLPGRGVQVCICDISMPDISGLELLSQLPKGMATIMLSVHDSPALVEQALNAGGHAAFFPNAVARMNSLLRCIRLPRAVVI
ncbi:response regulator [Escherichia coli]|nr:response regulator [Escherichia coli]